MASRKLVGASLKSSRARPASVTPAVLHQFEASMTTDNGICRIDGSDLGPLVPELLYRLWLVCDHCLDTGLQVQLESAAAGLNSLWSYLDPGHRGESEAIQRGSVTGASTGYAQLLGTTSTERDDAAARLVAFAIAQGLSRRTAYVLRTLVEEAVSNVTRYSGISKTAPIFLGVRKDTAKTFLMLADRGIAFDPTVWDTVSGDVTRDPGDDRPPFGIRLFRKLSHRTRYTRIDHVTNVLVLERHRE